MTDEIQITRADREAAEPIIGPSCMTCAPDHPVLQILARHRIQSTATLQAELASARKDAFNHGYLIAAANVMNMHDDPVIAEDLLWALGEKEGSIKRLQLCDSDAKPLRKLFRVMARRQIR